MANASGGDLAGAVSRAGGFGFIGAGYYSPETLRDEVDKAYRQIGVVNRESLAQKRERANLGIGILTWRLTELDQGSKPPLEGQDPMPSASSSKAMALVDEMLRARPKAVWLSFGDEQELVGWTRRIRRRDRELNPDLDVKGDQSLLLFVMVGREAELACAVEGCGADVLIAQGNEAGGHGHSESPPLSAIIAAVQEKLPSLKPTNAAGTMPPLLGAGGLSGGRSLASLLAQGCAGGVYGTRFLLTPEAQYSDLQKELLARSKSDDTKRTRAFDDARGTLGWPAGVDGRGINNLTVADYEKDMEMEKEQSDRAKEGVARRMERYKQAASEADVERLVIWSGTGVGGMDRIMPAAEVVDEITRDAVEAIQQAHSYVVA
ncbi:uncharacterized protein PFL1_00314 [Pseudozyma flocculosa PF-1]|nr:uncharacterized protein PFL1_00314 [Pseudozyma flocculosa PF-1]EPQ32117.1 hypothetical protein PFL1_00314 [Pseudozyma flocculosa PF-1]